MRGAWDHVIKGDSATLVKGLPAESVHLILSDIPYGISADTWDVLHSNTNSALLGASPAQHKAGGVFKSRGKPLNGWSEADRAIPKQYYDWCMTWAPEWMRILKPGGTAMVFSGRRLSHRCVTAMEDCGFTYKDSLAWIREHAAHRAQRLSVVFDRRGDAENAAKWEGWKVGNLRPTFEPILWFVKPYPIGTTIADNVIRNSVGAYNETALLKLRLEPNNVIVCGMAKGEGGLHPTQKPLKLMRTLIELTTVEGQVVLDPFCGSGTTLVAAQLSNRSYLGFEQDSKYCAIAEQRLGEAPLFRNATA